MFIDRYAYNAPLKSIDPCLKLFLTVAFLVLTLCVQRIFTMLLIFCITITAISIGGRISLFKTFKLLLIPIIFLISSVAGIMITISQSKNQLIVFLPFLSGYIGLSERGILLGTPIFIRALVSTSCLYFLIVTTPIVTLLSALRRLHIPNPLVTMMELMYRFIFILIDSADHIYLAQKVRLGYSSYRLSYLSLAQLASVVFLRAFWRVERVYRSLEARGYKGTIAVYEDSCIKYPLGYVYGTLMIFTIIIIEFSFRRFG